MTADHGEALGDHGELTHGFFVYEPTLRVPLVMAGPGRRRGAGGRSSRAPPTSLPTLLARLAVPVPQRPGRRRPVRSPPRREAYAETLYPETLGWAGCARCAWARSSTSTRRGPSCTTSLPIRARPATSRPSAHRTRSGCAAALEALAATARAALPAADDPEVAEQLRALGYVSRPARGRERPAARPEGRARGVARSSRTRCGRRRAANTSARPMACARCSAASRATPRSSRPWPRPCARSGRTQRSRGGAGAARDDRAVRSRRLARARSRPGRGRRHRRSDAVRAPRDRPRPVSPRAPQPPRIAARSSGPDRGGARRVRRALRHSIENNAGACTNRANALRSMGRRAEAAARVRDGRSAGPRGIPTRSTAWACWPWRRATPTGASALFQQALEIDPGYHEARLNLAVAEVRRGNLAAARSALTELLRRRPDAATAARPRLSSASWPDADRVSVRSRVVVIGLLDYRSNALESTLVSKLSGPLVSSSWSGAGLALGLHPLPTGQVPGFAAGRVYVGNDLAQRRGQ